MTKISGNKTSEDEVNYKSKRKKFNIDPYISFEGNEINLSIPFDVLFDPEKNKKLSEEKER